MKTAEKQAKTDVSIRAVLCPSCGRLLYPVPLVCRCGRVLVESDLKEVEVCGRCKLLSWTRLKAVPEGFDEPEMALGMVEFESGVRAVGLLRAEAPCAGMELDAEVEECQAGEYRHGLRHVLREVPCASS